ncbi:hypothetical protein D3C72_2476120 [compost metagenome]
MIAPMMIGQGSTIPAPTRPPIASMIGVAGMNIPIIARDSPKAITPTIGPAHVR